MNGGGLWGFVAGLLSGILVFTSTRRATQHHNCASEYEIKTAKFGRTLLATNFGAKQWTLLYDSNDTQPTEKETFDVKEEVLLGHNHGVVEQFLAGEVTTSRFLHVSVLCSGQSGDDMVNAIKDTWGPESHTLYFHASDHVHVFDRPQKDNIVVPGLQSRLPVLSLHHICDHLLDDFKWYLMVDDNTYVKVDELKEYLMQYSSDVEHLFGSWGGCDDGGYCINGPQGLVMSRRLLKAACPFIDPKEERANGKWSQYIVDSLKIANVFVQPLNQMTKFGAYSDVFHSTGLHPKRETIQRFQNILVLSGIPSTTAMTSAHVITVRQRLKAAKSELSVFQNDVKDLLVSVQRDISIQSHVIQTIEKVFSQQSEHSDNINPCSTPNLPVTWLQLSNVTNVRSVGICLTEGGAPVLDLQVMGINSQLGSVFVPVAGVIQRTEIIVHDE